MGDEKKLKVYCETTFWSYLVGRQTTDGKIPRDQAFTLKWRQKIAPKCDIYISQYVGMESAGYECPAIITSDEFLAKKNAFGL